MRPTKLTPAIEKIIIDTLRVGATFEAAAGRAGISVSTIHEWRRRGRGESLKGKTTKRLVEFAIAVDRAMADAETSIVAAIRKASAEEWQAGAWLLERRHPDRYGRVDRSKVELDATVAVRPAREEMAELMARFDKKTGDG